MMKSNDICLYPDEPEFQRGLGKDRQELDNTAVPLPFEIYATIRTAKYNEVEKLVHKTIDRLTDLRIRQNREFFNVSPQVALDIFRDIAMTVDDAEVTEYRDNRPVKRPSEPEKAHHERVCKRERLIFLPTGVEVRVAGDDTVEYEGRLYKLSPFTGTFMPEEKRNLSGAYQGAKYFSYRGVPLETLRRQMEREQVSE